MPKISIIIPHYKNNDSYLAECIASILQQTFSDFEVLLVDNTKGPRSMLAEELAKRDTRIIYIYREGIGKCGARNLGIELAKGDYVCFVDSDDFIDPSYLENLLKALIPNPNVSIAIGEGDCVDEKGAFVRSFSYGTGEISIVESTPAFAFSSAGKIGPWEHLIRRKAIGNLRFDETINTMEDRLFFLELYLCQKFVAFVHLPLYHYRATPFSDSSFRNIEWFRLSYLERLHAANRAFELVSSATSDKAVRRKALKAAIAGCLSYYCAMHSFHRPADEKGDLFRKQIIEFDKAERPAAGIFARLALRHPHIFYFAVGRWAFSTKARQRRARKGG